MSTVLERRTWNAPASRRFREFLYRTLKSWCRKRRVVAKAEWLPGEMGGNPRFAVTSFGGPGKARVGARVLYEV